MAIKVIIADDHKLIREGIKQLLEMDGSIEIVAQASDGRECLDLLSNMEADVLLLDINMPVLNGLEVLKILKKNRNPIKVLILTIHNEIEYLVKAFDIGFDGYVLKDSNSLILKDAINAVFKGENYIQPNLTPLLNAKILNRNINDTKMKELTKREIEVLKLIAEGLFNKEIGDKLKISERTVKNHVSNIFRKIGVADRTQAAVFAIKSNLVELI